MHACPDHTGNNTYNGTTSGHYYNRVTIVTQISWIILIIFKLLNVTTNNLAYLGYDRSYDRNTVIVQATEQKDQLSVVGLILRLIQTREALVKLSQRLCNVVLAMGL